MLDKYVRIIKVLSSCLPRFALVLISFALFSPGAVWGQAASVQIDTDLLGAHDTERTNNRFMYSFTEDSNNNGRIDRIRIQAAFDLMGENDVGHGGLSAFARFDVAVDGYTVDRSRGVRGYQRVQEVTGNKDDADMLYIYLEEKPYPDAAATPEWRITENESLFDARTRLIPIGLPEHGSHQTADTVPPRIDHAFAVPEHPEIFFRMSKPVQHGVTLVSPGTLNTVDRRDPVQAEREFLVTGSPSFNSTQLAEGSYTFELGNVRDTVSFVPDLSALHQIEQPLSQHDRSLPSPKYPLDWAYSAYIEVRGYYDPANPQNNINFEVVSRDPEITAGPLPPIREWYHDADNPNPRMGNKIDGFPYGLPYGSARHRVSDLLISLPPTNANSDRYIAWPLWARHDPDTLAAGNRFSSVIWDFTGKSALESGAIVMQARLGSAFSRYQPSIVSVHESDPRMVGSSLPRYGTFSAFNEQKADTQARGNPSSRLVNYRLQQDLLSGSGAFHFYFRIDPASDLLAGRLDIRAGSPVPSDWYRQVQPFSFEIAPVIQQRSGVTILNNVINASIRERVFLEYYLQSGGRVTAQVFTLDGTLVKVLENSSQAASDGAPYRLAWNGTNNGGRKVARGMYFIRIVAPDIDEIRKVMVVH